MERHRIAIVIPALNEAATIVQVIRAAQLKGTCVVVDDGSTDETAGLARAAGAQVVSHSSNRGYDAALDSGFRHAFETGCDVVVTLDADGQHDPGLVDRFLAAIEGGAAVALGVRSRRARLAEHMFAWYTRWRWGIADPLCGLKAYRIEVYRALGHFDSYRSIGTELMLFAARSGWPLVQIPFEVKDRAGPARFGRRVSANLKILRAMLMSLRSARRGDAPC
jgi:glycosyltransferase involved in cell wall biosynthesis